MALVCFPFFFLSLFSANFTKHVLKRLLRFVKNKLLPLVKSKAVNFCV